MRMIQSVMRESKESLSGQYQRDKQPVNNRIYLRLLMWLAYLTAIGIALFIGNIKKGNDFDLLVILLMLMAALPFLCNGNALNQTSRTTYRFRRLRAAGPWRLRRHKSRKLPRRPVLSWNKRLSGSWYQREN
jgi:hypothetical protein